MLLNAEEALRPAVALLKDTVALKRGQLIAAGLKAIDVFSIVQSGDLVKRLFEEIIKCVQAILLLYEGKIFHQQFTCFFFKLSVLLVNLTEMKN